MIDYTMTDCGKRGDNFTKFKTSENGPFPRRGQKLLYLSSSHYINDTHELLFNDCSTYTRLAHFQKKRNKDNLLETQHNDGIKTVLFSSGTTRTQRCRHMISNLPYQTRF